MIRELIEFVGEILGGTSSAPSSGKNEWLVAGIVVAVAVVIVGVLLIVAD